MKSTQDPSTNDLMAQLYAYTRHVEEQVHELSKKMEEGLQAEQAQNHKHIRYLEEQVLELNTKYYKHPGPGGRLRRHPALLGRGVRRTGGFRLRRRRPRVRCARRAVRPLRSHGESR